MCNLKELSISIVLYKTPLRHIKRCLDCLLNYNEIADIYLIDNSPNRTLEKVKTIYKGCRYIFTDSNQGYARGHNIALDIASNKQYRYHLLLNADCYFSGEIIKKLVTFMDMNLDIGLIMPKVLNPDGSIQMLCKFIPRPIDLFASYLIKVFGIKSLNSDHIMDINIHDKVSYVPYLSGCFMFLRWSTLNDIGFFDKRFFMYGEDIDLSRRIAEKYLTIYYPKLFIYHEHGKGSFKSLKLLLIHIKNITLYFNKWGWINDRKRLELNNKAKLFQKDLLNL